MVIISASFVAFTAIVTSLINSYAVNSTEKALQKAAHSMAVFMQQSYVEYVAALPYGTDTSKIDVNDFVENNINDIKPMIELLSLNIEDLRIIITDLDGKDSISILEKKRTTKAGQSENAADDEADTDDAQSALPEVKPLPFSVNNRLKGGYEFYRHDNLDGYFETPHLVYGVPIKTDNFGILGGVLATVENPGMDELLNTMLKTVILSSMWIMLTAIVVVYFLTEKIISPLKEMSRAAKQFADGQFDVRVPVRGHDEIAELATAFNNMADSLATMEQMRTTFLANVSHDLRTPMTTIAGFIDNILVGAIPPEKQDYYLGVIANEVKRLSRLVSSLLDISRMQAGERKFTMTTFDVCELARQVLISFEQKIEDHKLDVDFECTEDNMFVVADRDAIHQVIYNICDNGIKFSKKNGKFKVAVEYTDHKVRVSVYNEGVGIPPDDIKYVFERFYKSDKSRGLDKTGVGLGLYICKAIIKAHGEDIWVESDYGRNCKFAFTLPRTGK